MNSNQSIAKALAAATDTAILAKIGGGIVFVGCITGSVLAVAATIKYNKGLF